jgi:hypothetical protein
MNFYKEKGVIQKCHPERREGSAGRAREPAGRLRSFAALRMTGRVSPILSSKFVTGPLSSLINVIAHLCPVSHKFVYYPALALLSQTGQKCDRTYCLSSVCWVYMLY